jgi:hypothetical protein
MSTHKTLKICASLSRCGRLSWSAIKENIDLQKRGSLRTLRESVYCESSTCLGLYPRGLLLREFTRGALVHNIQVRVTGERVIFSKKLKLPEGIMKRTPYLGTGDFRKTACQRSWYDTPSMLGAHSVAPWSRAWPRNSIFCSGINQPILTPFN